METCFVIMPISTPERYLSVYDDGEAHFSHVYDHLFSPAIRACGLEPIPPEAEGGELIHARIIENLNSADLVLCDMSTLNPNVFYEFGIRTALNKPVCLVKDNHTERVPFDTSIINYQTYSHDLRPWTIEESRDALIKHISKTKRSNKNALWQYFGLSNQAHMTLPDPDSGEETKIDYLIRQIDLLGKKAAEKSYTSYHPSVNLRLILDKEKLLERRVRELSEIDSEHFQQIASGIKSPMSQQAEAIKQAINLLIHQEKYTIADIFPEFKN